MQKLVRKLNNLLASDRFFVFVVTLLVIQAVWLALTARYPMAFDENFHFGIIKLHAEQWSPFFSHTPPGSGEFGGLIRDPSYLYHYVMSFPYRLISLFTHDEMIQIITLRLINVAMFAAGLVAFRHFLQQLVVSRRLINLSLLMLVVIPVVPFLAAHINYDNLLFLLLPITLSFAFACGETLRNKGRLPVGSFIGLVILALLTSLVKYAFLPVLLAIGLYLFVIFWRQPNKKRVFDRLIRDFTKLRPLLQAGLIAGLLLSGGLFIERDVVNVVRYHTPSPSCNKVESVEHCLQFGPWARDYGYRQHIENDEWTKPDTNPFIYGYYWVRGLLHRLYFAINYNYFNYPPLPLLFYSMMTIGLLGCLLFAFFGRRILAHNPRLTLALLATLIYVAALFYTNYSAFLHLYVRVAINGRYLIPILPLMFVFMGLGYRQAFLLMWQPWRRYATLATALFIVFITLQGGGLLTFLVRSEPDWYWENQIVIDINRAAQQVVSPFIIGLD